jgi:hypothetical protein
MIRLLLRCGQLLQLLRDQYVLQFAKSFLGYSHIRIKSARVGLHHPGRIDEGRCYRFYGKDFEGSRAFDIPPFALSTPPPPPFPATPPDLIARVRDVTYQFAHLAVELERAQQIRRQQDAEIARQNQRIQQMAEETDWLRRDTARMRAETDVLVAITQALRQARDRRQGSRAILSPRVPQAGSAKNLLDVPPGILSQGFSEALVALQDM